MSNKIKVLITAVIFSMAVSACYSMKNQAKAWDGPNQYIVLSTEHHRDGSIQNGNVSSNPYKILREHYGSFEGKSIAIGVAPMFRVFQKEFSIFEKNLKNHLRESQHYQVPIFICLSSFVFNNARPDMWNWWDENAPGYNPQNRHNVEWYDWTPDAAVKIGWLNWGRQIRLPPMPNLMSPVYRKELEIAFTSLGTIVKEWYDQLPENQKWLLIGFRTTDEVAIGINNWYYPNGNSYLEKDPSADPRTGLDVYDLPSRGVQTIGYAAVKTAGIQSAGEMKMEYINEVCRRHCEYCSKLIHNLGFPREKIYSSSFGKTVDECRTCITSYSCPSWSFYHKTAIDPLEFSSALDALEFSDAPYWAMAEWGIARNAPAEQYKTSLEKALNLPKCRFVRLTGEWFRGSSPKAIDSAPYQALKEMVD